MTYCPSRFKNSTFENFKVTKDNKKAFLLCKEYCKNIEKNLKESNNLILSGNVGVGKTHLIWSIYKQLEKKIKVVVTSVPKIIDEIKYSFNNNGKFRDFNTYQLCFKCDLTIIDEVGVQYKSESERTMLYKLFNYRYEYMRPLILASNLPSTNDQNPKHSIRGILGERIHDRVFTKGSGYVFVGGRGWR